MNEKNILSLLVGPGLFSNKELKEVASKAFNPKFLKEFDELNIKLPDDTRENERLADDASDASPISIDDDVERELIENNNRLEQKYRDFALRAPKANLFQRTRLEDENFEDFEEEDEPQSERQSIPRPLPLILQKQREIKPNPYEKLNVKQVLAVVGLDKTGEIYRLTDLYLPTTKEHRANVFKYMYRNMLRNPKDILKRSRHERAVNLEKEILRIFKILYDQKSLLKPESKETKTPEANVTILKDSVKNPIIYSQDPVFSPLNSTEWFNSLQTDLMRGIQGETKMEIEKEMSPRQGREGRIEEENGRVNGWTHHNDHTHIGTTDGRLIHIETSSKRIPNGATSVHGGGPKTEKYNFQKVLSSLFESTPTRDNDEKPASERSEEDQSINQFGENMSRNEEDSNGFLNTYKRSLNQNMREHLNDNYDRDRKALFSFYTLLRGHDKAETSLWGETNKEVMNEYYGMKGGSGGNGKINYNYVVVPFRNERNRSIFKYQADVQDASEMELSLLHKKRKLDKNTELKLKQGTFDNNMYYNKNLLEASWDEFFFKPKANDVKEREYSQILIDLNDKSVFYDKIHPKILGVQKATKKTVAQFAEVPEQQNVFGADQLDEESKMLTKIDAADVPIGSTFRPSGKDYLDVGGDRTQHAPSETDSISISKRDRDIASSVNKEQKRKMKEIRVNAVKKGFDPDRLTKENARDLLGRSGKSELKSDNIALPSILKIVNDLKRKIGTQAVIQHSKVAEEFQFNEFHIKRQDFEYFHRPDLKRLMDPRQQPIWKVEIVKRQEEEKKERDFVPEDPFGVNELVHSFEYFKNHRRLSLREGKFALFEYIEENPLILSNVGMASRINRYVYSQRAYTKLKEKQPQKTSANENEELMEFIKLIKDTLGSNGSISFLDEKQSLPLIGQLTNDKFIGVTVIDNNMFYAPIFIHKAPETDFVLVRYTSSDGSQKCYLRKIEYIYTVGQIEPKVEVFNPSCRGLTSFIRKSIKHVIKKKFSSGEAVQMEEMKQLFPTVNDHNMKKYIQMYGGDPDPDDNKRFFYNKDLDHDLMDEDMERNEGNITPEEVCQYERMHASNVRLKNIGLEDLRSCDKINTIRNRYIKRNNLKIWNDQFPVPEKKRFTKMNIVANNVSEELQLTAWNLSQSFLSSKQKQGRLYLTGFGDPTGGHGGYSYVKLPLKTSRYEKEEKKNNSQKLSQVTGTESDLRKLPIKHVDRMILSYGNYKEEHISKLSRWDKIDLLRQIANDQPDNEELAKYARAFRLTTKMQREKYQKDINNLFMNLVTNLSKQGNDDIASDNEGEFECHVDQLIDKELEETLKKAPKDLGQAEEQARLEEEKGEDDNAQDDAMDAFDF